MPAKKKAIVKPMPGSKSDHAMIDRMLRVDHAGEYGAHRIYKGQIDVLGNSPMGDELRHMAAQEDEHLATFSKMLPAERVRPTALQPLWHVLAYAMGAGTAKLGEKAAMACTVAVEEVIVEHYEKQIEMLKNKRPDLAKLIERIKNEEDEHREIGIENDAEQAPGYKLIHRAVRTATKTAIWLSERV